MASNAPNGELGVRTVEHIEGHPRSDPIHAFVQQRLHHLHVEHAHIQSGWSYLLLVKLPLELMEACPRDSDPSCSKH